MLAVVVWEAANAGIDRYLSRPSHARDRSRAARRRTVLPFLRTTLLVPILLVAWLAVLSRIGIDVAPLLAGAGVIGIAVGFGSQTLVKDVITGLFLLLEDAMQVGDSAVTIKGQVKTTPAGRWSVQREINRRIKRRFEALGIEIPFPVQTVLLGDCVPPHAPPHADDAQASPPPRADPASAPGPGPHGLTETVAGIAAWVPIRIHAVAPTAEVFRSRSLSLLVSVGEISGYH